MEQVDIDYLKTLPYDTIKDILYNSSVDEINSLCSTDKYIQRICNDENFWKQYVFNKHGITNCCKRVAQQFEKTIPIYKYRREYIRSIVIIPEMTLRQVLNEVLKVDEYSDYYEFYIKRLFDSPSSYTIRYENNIIYFRNKFGNYSKYTEETKSINDIGLYDILLNIWGHSED
jgi:hypothetical protein